MNDITIVTPDNIEIKYRLSGAGSRSAAAVVDLVIQVIVMAIVIILFLLFQLGRVRFSLLSALSDFSIAMLIIILLGFLFGYYLLFEMLWKGQTPGKRLFGLRVIRINGMPVNFLNSFIRTALKFFVDFFAVGVFAVFFSKKCRRIGDMVGGTVVIIENPAKIDSKSLTIDMLTTDTQTQRVQSNFSLTESEYLLLKEFFAQSEDMIDKLALWERITAYFSTKFGAPPEKLSEYVMIEIMKMNANRY